MLSIVDNKYLRFKLDFEGTRGLLESARDLVVEVFLEVPVLFLLVDQLLLLGLVLVALEVLGAVQLHLRVVCLCFRPLRHLNYTFHFRQRDNLVTVNVLYAIYLALLCIVS